ncbi:MAG TPA: LysM domain-containing protein, partial [Verrucomicrobiae bacterium]
STGGEVYTIKSGDTLTKIAHSHGTTVKAIETANSGLDPNHIKVGQKLTIPSKAEAAAPAPEPAPVTPAPVAPVMPPSTTPAK